MKVISNELYHVMSYKVRGENHKKALLKDKQQTNVKSNFETSRVKEILRVSTYVLNIFDLLL